MPDDLLSTHIGSYEKMNLFFVFVSSRLIIANNAYTCSSSYFWLHGYCYRWLQKRENMYKTEFQVGRLSLQLFWSKCGSNGKRERELGEITNERMLNKLTTYNRYAFPWRDTFEVCSIDIGFGDA